MGRRYSNPIMVGSRIRAADVAEVRTYIDQDIAAAGLAPHPWTWNNVVAGDRILAVQFKEMKAAIQRLWDFKARGPIPMWSSGVEPGGPSVGTAATIIRASDLTDLRIWLNQYEDNHPPSAQGVNSFAANPDNLNVIPEYWPWDIRGLGSVEYVRCKVAADSNDVINNGPLGRYRIAFQRYVSAGLIPIALFDRQFYRDLNPPPGETPNSPLDGNFTNRYITLFSDRAALIANDLKINAGVNHYIIWNEPNNWPGYYDPGTGYLDNDRFAALMYWCWQKMRVVNIDNIYMGGILYPWSPPWWTPETGRAEVVSRLRGVYDALFNNGRAGGDFGPWPWSGVNIHIHDKAAEQDVAALITEVRDLMAEKGDYTPLIVGEWGVTEEEENGDPGAMSSIFNSLKLKVDMMIYYTHPRDPVDPGNSQPPHWSLHTWDEPGGGEFRLLDETSLHDIYDSLV